MRRVATCCVLLLGMIAACASDDAGPKAGSSNVNGAAGTGGGAGTIGAAGAAAGADETAGASGSTAGTGTAGIASMDSGTDGAQVTDGGPWPVGDPGSEGDGKITINPPYVIQPDLTDRGKPKGTEFTFKLTSKLFQMKEDTLDHSKPINQPRGVWVYVPRQYQDGTPAALMVIQDGLQGGRYDLIKYALDNLTTSTDPSRKIPPFIAIAVQDGGDDGMNSERGLEYDTVSDRYVRFVQDEVLPAVSGNADLKTAYPNFKFTDNPEGKAAFGCSSGSAAALTMAWFRPDLFRRVITYSGTFVAQQDTDAPERVMYPHGAWDYHSDLKLIANTDKKPIRIFTNANQNDNGSTAPESGRHNWVMANDRTAQALQDKGYHNRYVFGNGAGHCDTGVLKASLADAIVWTWRGYPAN